MTKPASHRSAATRQAGRGPTIRTIAEITGLSLSTVSLSLRGGGTLKEETRERVLEVAKHLGYVPNRAGVRLRTGKTNVLAYILDCAEDSIDFARHMIQGIGQAINGTRYHLTVVPEFEHTDPLESIRYIANHRTADGVIITHTKQQDSRVQLMMEAGFPFVTHGRTDSIGAHAYHDFHSERFSALAVERLVAKGCSDILLVAGHETIMNFRNTVDGFLAASARMGATGHVIEAAITHASVAELRCFGHELSLRSNRPDGIIFASEVLAMPVIRGLEDGQAALGHNIQVIYKQTSDFLPTLFPEVDSLEENIRAAGAELANLLMRQISGEPAESLQTLREPIMHWRS